jgi:hypothetical protein
MAGKKKPDPYDKNERCYCTLAGPTRRLLDILARKGTHGPERPDVMSHLIMAGLQVAIEKGYLPEGLAPPAPPGVP